MTIESAYSDYLRIVENLEPNNTCFTRAIDASLLVSEISPKLREELRGQKAGPQESADRVIDEVFDGAGQFIQVNLNASNDRADRAKFDKLTDWVIIGKIAMSVWTTPTHIEALLPALTYKFPEDEMVVSSDRMWMLSDHYFATRFMKLTERFRALTLDEVWGKMTTNPDGQKQLLVFPAEKES